MRAIIIDDKDARALLELLELARFRAVTDRAFVTSFWQEHEPAIRQLISDIHRKFHFEVTRWLQDQGANTVR